MFILCPADIVGPEPAPDSGPATVQGAADRPAHPEGEGGHHLSPPQGDSWFSEGQSAVQAE